MKSQHNIGKHLVTEHGVQTETVDRSQAEARENLGISNDKFVIVEPGYIRPEKGHEEFIEIADKFQNIEFVIGGGSRTEDHDSFVKQIKESAGDNVTVTGVLDDDRFHDVFIAADLILLPYREITQSGIFNWAAAYEKPVVARSNKYFTPISDRYGGVECYDSIEEVEDIISNIINEEDRLINLKDGMIEYKTQNSMGEIAKKHEELYANQIGQL